MLFFERLLKYKLHRVTSKVSEPRKGLRKVCSRPDVVNTSVKKIMFIPYIYIIKIEVLRLIKVIRK